MFLNFVVSVSFFVVGSQVMPTSMPPPRKLPQRPWAASIPTTLTHNALHVLLLPSPTPCLVPGLAGSYLCSPLERFLGSVIMRRHLQRIIQQEPNVSVAQVTSFGEIVPGCHFFLCSGLLDSLDLSYSSSSCRLWTLMSLGWSCSRQRC